MKVTKYQKEQILSLYEDLYRKSAERAEGYWMVESIRLRGKMRLVNDVLNIFGLAVTIDPETEKAILQH